eukprot:scaffold88686_cov72-Phaeocystis_antarctica.AAC.1
MWVGCAPASRSARGRAACRSSAWLQGQAVVWARWLKGQPCCGEGRAQTFVVERVWEVAFCGAWGGEGLRGFATAGRAEMARMAEH